MIARPRQLIASYRLLSEEGLTFAAKWQVTKKANVQFRHVVTSKT